jgi:stress response protein YsnF
MGRQLPVALTRAQVERSPDIDTKKPVSRQHEAQYFGYYRYPYYWGGAGLWGMGAYPGSLTVQDRIEVNLKAHASHAPPPDDCHLRSSSAVIGHHIKATDGNIGHLEDLLVDDHTWAIRHLIVNTSNWWGGKRVLIEPHSITGVSWSDAQISVDLTRQAVKDAPTYVSAAQVDPQSEPTINGHYRLPGRSTAKTRHHRSPSRRAHHALRDDGGAGSHNRSP